MAKLVTAKHENQIDGVVDDIKCSLAEDFIFLNGPTFTSKQQMQEAIDLLKAKVATISIDDVFFGDDEE